MLQPKKSDKDPFEGVTYGSSIKQHQVENKYDQYLLPGVDKNQSRARQQGAMASWANGIGAAVTKIPGNVIGNLASIVDYEDYLNQDDEVGNFVTAKMQELGQHIDNFFPVYELEPGKPLSIGDSAWWAKNMSSVIGSGLEFAITGQIVSGTIGAGLALTGISGPVGGAIGLLGTALALNQAEAIVSAQEVYKTSFEYNKKQGKTDDESKQIAAAAAAYTVNINRLNLPLNLTSSALFIKTPKASRAVYNSITRANTLSRLGLEGAQEYGEEVINHIAQKEGERSGEGKKYNVYNTMNDIFSAEGIEAGMLGFLGGIVQTGAVEASNEILGKNDFERQMAAQQKADWELHDSFRTSVKGQKQVKTILDNVAVNASYQDKIYEADVSKNVGESERLRGELLQYNALDAFKHGTTASLVKTFDDIAAEQGGEDKYGKDYQQRAIQAKQQVLAWEDKYNDYISKYDDAIGEHLFMNNIERDNLAKEFTKLHQEEATIKAQIADYQSKGIATTEQEVELGRIATRQADLVKRIKANGEDLSTIMSKDFNEEAYKRSKIEAITGKPLSQEEATKIKVEENVKKVEEAKTQEEAKAAVEPDKQPTPVVNPQQVAAKQAEILKEDFKKMSNDRTPLNNKRFKVDLGDGKGTYIIKDGVVSFKGSLGKDGQPIADDKVRAEFNTKAKAQVDFLNSLTASQLQALIDNAEGASLDKIVKAKERADKVEEASYDPDKDKLVTAEDLFGEPGKQSFQDVVNQIAKELSEFIDRASKLNVNNDLKQELNSIVAKADSIKPELLKNKFMSDRLNKLYHEALAAIDEVNRRESGTDNKVLPKEETKKLVDDVHVSDDGVSAADMVSEFNYKSHTAFRTTDQMFEKALAGNDKDSLAWQQFVNTLDPKDASNYMLRVLTKSDPEYDGLLDPVQRKWEKDNKQSGILVVLTDRDGKYIYPESKAEAKAEPTSQPNYNSTYSIQDGKLVKVTDSYYYFDVDETTGEFRVSPDKIDYFLNSYSNLGDVTDINIRVQGKEALGNAVGKIDKSGNIVEKLSTKTTPVVAQPKPLVSVLLKNEEFVEHGESVSKENMARHMGLTDPKLIDDAYAKMWEDARAFRERLLTGEIKYLPINGMGKGVPRREDKPVHPILGRLTNDPTYDDLELVIGAGEYVVGEGAKPYQILDGQLVRAGVLYAKIKGEYIPLDNRLVNGDEINEIVSELSKLTQDNVTLNKQIEDKVKRLIFVTTNPDKMLKENRFENTLFIKGNTIYYGKDGKIQASDLAAKGTEFRKFLAEKKRRIADASMINHNDKVIRVAYRKSLFDGSKPAFRTDRLKMGELGRVNNYFTYNPDGAIDQTGKLSEVRKDVIVPQAEGLNVNPYANVKTTKESVVAKPVDESKPVTKTPLLNPKERKIVGSDNNKLILVVSNKIYREMQIDPSFSKEDINGVIKDAIEKGATSIEEVKEAITNYCKK